MKNDPLSIAVAAIIRDMALPVVRNKRRREGVDLEPHARALRNLVDEVWEEHDFVERDLALRSDPKKPTRREWARTAKAVKPKYDYSAYLSPHDKAQLEREHAEHYDSVLARPRSNPGVSHYNGLPLAPLAAVYELLRQRWQARDLGWAWDPDYRADEDHRASRLESMNPSLRMLYLVARSCGPEYSVTNCLSIHDRLKSQPRAANKATKARIGRKKAAKPRPRKKTK